MGYYTRFDGEITIDPPLTWQQLKDCKYADKNAFYDLRIEIETVRQETEFGENIIREGTTVIPSSDDSYKGYGIKDALREIIDAFPDSQFTGSIRAEGEESGDIWRMVATGREMRVEKAKIAWEDGTTETIR